MSRDIVDGKPAAAGILSKRDWQALTPALSEWLLEAIASMGFRQMTPVQASTIPLFLGNKDVVVEAVTGSGKTLSFLIPAIEKLLKMDEPPKRHHIGAIIISPTRELASQIFQVLQSLLAFHAPSSAHIVRHQDAADDHDSDTPLQPPQVTSIAPKIISQLLLGGTTTPAQDIASFLSRSPNLIVATPGRLLELLSSPHVHCTQSSFEMLVMDEADRLLDLGFSDTLRKIFTRLPKQRRTGLFSASMSEALDQLIRVGLRNPVKVAVRVKSLSGRAEGKTPASLQMSYLIVDPQHKLPAMCKLLSTLNPTPQKAVVYLSTCAAVDYFSRVLPSLLPQPFTLVPLHGKQPPQVRTRNFSRFLTSSSPTLLLTTDVAARGLDIPNVDLVLQLDPPSDPKTFVHRCGRTGRAGRRGLAITFLTSGKEESYVEFLALRGTPVSPLALDFTASDSDAASLTAAIRAQVRADRALHDAAQRAFVSWVRSYAKHAASAIFSVRDLDWAAHADAWGLLRLPKMPEAKGWEGRGEGKRDRNLGLGVDWDAFRYRDAAREKRRVEELEAYREGEGERVAKRVDVAGAEEGEEGRGKSADERKRERAWSRKKDGQKTREERREKRGAKREVERRAKMTDEEKRRDDELEALIGKVRQRTAEAATSGGKAVSGGDDEWDGFSD